MEREEIKAFRETLLKERLKIYHDKRIQLVQFLQYVTYHSKHSARLVNKICLSSFNQDKSDSFILIINLLCAQKSNSHALAVNANSCVENMILFNLSISFLPLKMTYMIRTLFDVTCKNINHTPVIRFETGHH